MRVNSLASQRLLAGGRVLVDGREDAVLHDPAHEVHKNLVLVCLGDRLHDLQRARVEAQHVHCPAHLLLGLDLLDAAHDATVKRLDKVTDPADDAEERELPGAEVLQQLAADHLHVLAVGEALQHEVHERGRGHLLGVGREQRGADRVGHLPERQAVVDLVLEGPQVHLPDELRLLLGVLLYPLEDEVRVRPEDLAAGRRQAGDVHRVQRGLPDLQVLVAEALEQRVLGRQDRRGRAVLRGREAHGRDRGGAHPPAVRVLVREQGHERPQHRVLVHHQQVPERLGDDVPHALLLGVRILGQDRQHPRYVRPEVLRHRLAGLRPLRHAEGHDLAERGQQQVLRLLALGSGAGLLHIVDEHLEERAHGADRGVAQGQRRGLPDLVLLALQLPQQSLAEARRRGEVRVLPRLAQRQERELALVRGLGRGRRLAALHGREEVLHGLDLHVLGRGPHGGREALGQRAYHMPLRLRLRGGNARGVTELLPQPLEGAVRAVLRDPRQEQQDRVQRRALQQRRPAHGQHGRHALLHDHGRHLRRGLERLDGDLHAEVRDVQVRVCDEGHDVAVYLHQGLRGHAVAVLLHEVHERVQALLPEGPAVLAQVQRQVPAHRRQHRGQGRDAHLGDAHRLQGLDRRGARDLVLDALHEGRQARLQRGLEGRQVPRAGREVAEALKGALLDLLVDVRGHQLTPQHLEDGQHLRELRARLAGAGPQRVDEAAGHAQRLRDRLVVGVPAALQQQRAEQRRQLLVDRGRGEAVAQVPQAHERVQAHAGVALLLQRAHELVLDLRQVRLQVLGHALRERPQERERALPGLGGLRAQLLVQLLHALRQHGHEVLRRRPLLRRRGPLDLQDARGRRGGSRQLACGEAPGPGRRLVLGDRRLRHVREGAEDVQLHALLALLEARDQRHREPRVDLLELVGQAPDHGGQHLERCSPNLPGVVVVVGIHEAIVVKLLEAVVHGTVLVVA
mmetsp:Transcript_5242/g.15476  ORF Transcript_5242/g.15476 Transcript_5242/m.15476 type:complete len:966 (+) Transcript_5242:75-2972(+)